MRTCIREPRKTNGTQPGHVGFSRDMRTFGQRERRERNSAQTDLNAYIRSQHSENVVIPLVNCRKDKRELGLTGITQLLHCADKNNLDTTGAPRLRLLEAMLPAKARKMGLSESTNQQGKKNAAAQIRLRSRYCAGKGRVLALRTLVVPGSRWGRRVRPLFRSISSIETANTWKSGLLSLSLGIK